MVDELEGRPNIDIKEKCCDRMRKINNEGTIVCTSCGQISDYVYVGERINFDGYRDKEILMIFHSWL